MNVSFIKEPTARDWMIVKNLALGTVDKKAVNPPDTIWKTKMLISEHSPIYTLRYIIEWTPIKSWVATHFVRHHVGSIPYVTTQRNDRQDKYDRDTAPQDAPVTLRIEANAMAIINISKKRLCKQAHGETRDAWNIMLKALKVNSPELASLCVPSCIYRNGICPEVFGTCGYASSASYRRRYEEYINEIYHKVNK